MCATKALLGALMHVYSADCCGHCGAAFCEAARRLRAHKALCVLGWRRCEQCMRFGLLVLAHALECWNPRCCVASCARLRRAMRGPSPAA